MKQIPPIPKSVWHNHLHFIVFGFGAGTLPIAPGTFGTLVAIPFYLLLQFLPLPLYLIFVFFFTLAAIFLCHHVEKQLAVHDHPGMCIDEIVGYFITMIHAPRGILWVFLGFLFFRIFDIWKPWPIRQLDRDVGGGLGVILDDVMAGLYSFIGIQLIAAF